MNLTTWTAIREYIAAEIALADARRELTAMQVLGANEGQQDAQRAHIASLEGQSTRMETAIREGLDGQPKVKCRKCNGLGWFGLDGKRINCGDCNGSGSAPEGHRP